MKRRQFLLAGALAPWSGRFGAQAHSANPECRFGLTPVFLDERRTFLNSWRAYLEARLDRPVRFVQRGTYREIIDQLRQRTLDFAWVCGYPYARFRADLRLIAVPLFDQQPLYRSYLIVPAHDTAPSSILHLRGKVFAFSDPDSNSGFLFPNYLLGTHGERADGFFRRTFFTWAHRAVVEAVAGNLADAGAVDGYVWEVLNRYHPALTSMTRIMHTSPLFGFPPIVANASVPEGQCRRFEQVLVSMGADGDGVQLLRQLHLDGFTPGGPELYDSIAAMMQAVPGGRT